MKLRSTGGEKEAAIFVQRPTISRLDAASGYWGSLCHTGCSAGGFLQFAEQNVCLLHGSRNKTQCALGVIVDAVDMQLTSNR